MIMNGLSQGGGSDNRVPIIYNTSYVGTGTYGVNNPTTLTFDFVPEIVIISSNLMVNNYAYAYPALVLTPYIGWIVVPNIEMSNISYQYFSYLHCSTSVDKKTYNFYTRDSGKGSILLSSPVTGTTGQTSYPRDQYNNSGTTYHVLAIGYKEES